MLYGSLASFATGDLLSLVTESLSVSYSIEIYSLLLVINFSEANRSLVNHFCKQQFSRKSFKQLSKSSQGPFYSRVLYGVLTLLLLVILGSTFGILGVVFRYDEKTPEEATYKVIQFFKVLLTHGIVTLLQGLILCALTFKIRQFFEKTFTSTSVINKKVRLPKTSSVNLVSFSLRISIVTALQGVVLVISSVSNAFYWEETNKPGFHLSGYLLTRILALTSSVLRGVRRIS